MNSRKLICAALSALFVWTGSASVRSLGEEAPAAKDGAGFGERPSLEWFEEKGLELAQSSVFYPALKEGAAEEKLRQTVNERILEDGGIRDYVTRISQLISGGSLKAGWQGEVNGRIFSFAVSAEGAVDGPRPTFVWTGGNIDLSDGHEITPEEMLTDPEAFRERAEAYLEEEVAPELSLHLQNSGVTPAPELFRITAQGLVLMYPVDQLSTLSDRAGDVLIPWIVFRDLLRSDFIAALGAEDWLIPEEERTEEARAANAERIRAMTAEGRLPGIPCALGEALKPLTDTRRMLTDPDVYMHGRLFALEGACFRNVFLMTDYLSEDWDASAVDGIRADLGCFWGLTVGETTRETWLAMLGEPEITITMDEEQAEAYRTVPGTRDYYAFGENRLQLHGDEEGLLVSVILSE